MHIYLDTFHEVEYLNNICIDDLNMTVVGLNTLMSPHGIM